MPFGKPQATANFANVSSMPGESDSARTREHLKAAGVSLQDVINLLNVLAGRVHEVAMAYLWRPQLRDPADDMVLEAAVNGRAGTIITFNERDFLPQALSFGLVVLRPEQFFRGK